MNEFGVTYENLRGTNYVFNSSLQLQADFSLFSFRHSDPSETRRGTYSPVNVESELLRIAASGFNNLRIWPPFFGWVIDAEQFEENLRDFVARCRAHRLTITWVLWNAIGNGILWQSHDLLEIVGEGQTEPVHGLGLYDQLETLTQVFQNRYGHWVPDNKPWHLTGYPAPGNNLLKASGDPSEWTHPQAAGWAEGYLDALLRAMASPDGVATMMQVDLANEFDGVFIPLPNIIRFLRWNQDRVRAVLPDVPLTVGWAFHEVEQYSGYVDALAKGGIEVAQHSFHVYVQDPQEYETLIAPLLDWADSQGLPMMVTEFYRLDTAEWGRLREGLEFFYRRRVPIIIWGFISSNIFDNPNKPGNQGTPHLDGIVTARNLELGQSYDFDPLQPVDLAAVEEFNDRVAANGPGSSERR